MVLFTYSEGLLHPRLTPKLLAISGDRIKYLQPKSSFCHDGK
jgi:hypothetical protein